MLLLTVLIVSFARPPRLAPRAGRIALSALNEEDAELVTGIGGERAGVYGEMTAVGFRSFARRFGLSTGDTFVDLGSGTGALVLQAAAEFGAQAVGIELAHSRHQAALTALSTAPEEARSLVTFVQGDAASDAAADILDRATVVYCSNLLFDDALQARFAARLGGAGPQLRGFALLMPFSHAVRGFVQAASPVLCRMSWDIHDLDHPCPVYMRGYGTPDAQMGGEETRDSAPQVAVPGFSSDDTAEQRVDPLDPDVERDADGRYFNTRLSAPNVWEVDLCPSVVAEAAALCADVDFRSLPRHPVGQSVRTGSGRAFYVTWPNTWESDVLWVSVDDQPTYDAFRHIFERLDIPKRFGHLVSGEVNLISAFYVVRSKCDHTNYHRDWVTDVGTEAFTLITPLHDYKINYSSEDQFQLSYCACKTHAAPGEEMKQELELHGHWRRYEYRSGKAIVFASQFLHGTETGKSIEPAGAPHVYLCFTFGSDERWRWAAIGRTASQQARVVARANGVLELSEFGKSLERAATAHVAQ